MINTVTLSKLDGTFLASYRPVHGGEFCLLPKMPETREHFRPLNEKESEVMFSSAAQ